MYFTEGHILREFHEGQTLLVRADLRYPMCGVTADAASDAAAASEQKRVKKSPEAVLSRNMTRYFDALCEACLHYAEEKLYPVAKAEYAADMDPLKRFRFAPYVYTLRYTLAEKEGTAEICVALNLVRRGQKCTALGEKKVQINWDKSIGMMIPIK